MSPSLLAIQQAQRADSPEAAVRSACRRLLQRAGGGTPPVALKPLLSALKVRHSWTREFRRRGRGNATLQSIDGDLVVFIHAGATKRDFRKERFLIAHELVHALLIRMLGDGRAIADLESSPEAHKELERLCDIGALELLMPARALRESVRHFGVHEAGLRALYDRFLVSWGDLLDRLVDVHPHTSLVRWRPYARHSEEERRYRVVRTMPRYERGGTSPWMPKGMTTKHLSDDVVLAASRSGRGQRTVGLEVTLNTSQRWTCDAVATPFPRRPSGSTFPLFEGFEVPDDVTAPNDREVLLFLANRAMTGSLWEGTPQANTTQAL